MDGGRIGYGKFHNGTLRMLKSFVRGAQLSFVNKGGSGMTLKCVNPHKTPYVNSATGENVHTILIKFGLVDESHEEYDVQIAGRNYSLTPQSKPEFADEVTMQLRVLRHSAHICPSILMYRILDEAEINELFGTELVVSDLAVSLIVMEMVEDAVSLEDSRYAAMARAKFLYMGARGINHGDFHKSNVLVSPSTGDVYVIDFGRARSLSPEDTRLIEASVAAEDYVQGLRLLLMRGSSSRELVDDRPNKYLDFCEARHWANTAEVNRAIKRLTRDGPFLKHYTPFYGWVFSDAFLNLNKRDKKKIAEKWKELRQDARTFGKEFQGDSLSSFGSELSTSSGGRTRRRKRTS